MNKIFYFWIHLVIVIIMWSSPFWLAWKIILFGVFLYYLQLITFGDCLLIKKQFNTKKRIMTIYTQILEYLGFKPNRKVMVFISDYIFPWAILLAAIVFQNI